MCLGEGMAAGTGGKRRGSGKSAGSEGEKGGGEALVWAGRLYGWWSKVVLYGGSSARAIVNGRFDAYPDMGPNHCARMRSEGRAVRSITRICDGGYIPGTNEPGKLYSSESNTIVLACWGVRVPNCTPP